MSEVSPARSGAVKPLLTAGSFWRRQDMLRRRFSRALTADWIYLVDVVGSCNLRCPSCPVGNSSREMPKKVMSIATFSAILDKIGKAGHKQPMLSLFNWGEATLHPDLAGIVRLIKERGYKSEISTNLNHFPDMEAVMAAGPTCIRVSLSGARNASYQQTHARGDIDRVLANMRQLAELADKYDRQTQIQVGYHVYRHNFPDEFAEMATLAHELGFYFEPTIATLMPVELVVDIAEGKVPVGDYPIAEKLVFPIETMTEGLRRSPDNVQCLFRTQMTAINADTSVSLCCATYADDYVTHRSFLDDQGDDIPAACASLCDRCQQHKFDLLFTDRKTDAWWKRADAILGEDWARFMDNFNRLGGAEIWFNDGFISIQALYEQAFAEHQKWQLADAEAIYQQILEVEPSHSTALYQMARIRMAQEAFADAYQYLRRSLEGDLENPHIRVQLARTAVILEKYREARGEFKRLLRTGHRAVLTRNDIRFLAFFWPFVLSSRIANWLPTRSKVQKGG